jgi:aminoglycoside phosphotransferase (APT) family kinase protein
MNSTTLTPELDALVSAARTLPPELVRQVADFAEFLGKKHSAPAVDESDAWSDEDLHDFARASAQVAAQNPPTA